MANVVQADWVTLRVPDEEGLRLVTIAGPETFSAPPTTLLSEKETLCGKKRTLGVEGANPWLAAWPTDSTQGMEKAWLVPL